MSNILVVEDESHLAEGLRFNLEAEGYQVNVVETGEAALELFEEGGPRFDVVVLDVMLPGKDGFTVISELRQAGQFVPTLMLTARSVISRSRTSRVPYTSELVSARYGTPASSSARSRK